MQESQTLANNQQRDILAFGQTTVVKFQKLKILIQGLGGLGSQISQNLIMLGPNSILLADDQICQVKDQGSNIFITKDKIGKECRAAASCQGLQQLNPNVHLKVISEKEINNDLLKTVDIVVFTNNYNIEQLVQIDKFCRQQAKPIGFIHCGILGLYTFVFVDFGEGFKIYDSNGEEPIPLLIDNIKKASAGVVTVNKEKPHNYQDGDFVRIYDVNGMTEVNGTDTRPIRVIDQYSFSIEDTSEFSDYVKGGFVELTKVPYRINFKSFEQALETPYSQKNKQGQFSCPYKNDNQMPEQLHIGLLALFEFSKQNNHQLPKANDLLDAEKLYNLAKGINESHKIKQEQLGESAKKQSIHKYAFTQQLNQKIIYNISKYAQAQLPPVCSFLGSLVSMEIIKYTGKFQPINEFFHYEFFETLPQQENVEDKQPLGTRYDDQIVIFGRKIHEKLSSLKVALAGTGCCGCEYLKNFALMGIGSDNKGLISLFDDSLVDEQDNHFFLSKDRKDQAKVEVAKNKIAQINSEINVQSNLIRASKKNNYTIKEEFWQSIDLLIGAVDKIESRQYLNYLSIWYEKPLLDTHVLSMQCQSENIIPQETATLDYYLQNDKNIIKMDQSIYENFPFLTDHNINWAMSIFKQLFTELSKDCNNYLQRSYQFISQINKHSEIGKIKIKIIHQMFVAQKKINFENLINLALELYEHYFMYKIEQLIRQYPLEYQVNGQPFWSGYKKFPQPLEFDITDEMFVGFITTTANLYAIIFGVVQNYNKGDIIHILKSNLNRYENQEYIFNFNNEDEHQLEKYLSELINHKVEIQQNQINLIKIDDDKLQKSLCIDFVTQTTNLKGRAYNIMETQKHKVEKKAFNINRNVFMVISLITGISAIELYKYSQSMDKKLFRNADFNLAINQYKVHEPISIQEENSNQENKNNQIVYLPKKFNQWDKYALKDLRGGSMMKILDFIKQEFDIIEIDLLKIENLTVKSKFDNIDLLTGMDENLKIRPDELYYKMYRTDIMVNRIQVLIVLKGRNSKDQNCEFPNIVYYIK